MTSPALFSTGNPDTTSSRASSGSPTARDESPVTTTNEPDSHSRDGIRAPPRESANHQPAGLTGQGVFTSSSTHSEPSAGGANMISLISTTSGRAGTSNCTRPLSLVAS